jgi:hypothetical protein
VVALLPTTDATVPEPAGATWTIDDPVTRLRIYGSERAFDLAPSDRWVLGAAPECSLHLYDPSGQVSRRHALACREGAIWMLTDLGSTNRLRINREYRRSCQLAPGDEIELGGLTLIAESHRSIELHELLRRWLGWSPFRLAEVDRALREVRAMANLRTALVLRSAGGLVGVARRLHRLTLGDRPFIPLGQNEHAFDRARNGTLYIDAREPLHGLRAALPHLRPLDLRVVACVDSTKAVADLAASLSRIAMLSIPPVTERRGDAAQLLEAYGMEAAAKLGTSWLALRPDDSERVLSSGVVTLDEFEAFTLRLVALRSWGVTEGAKRLGITHGALSRWARRWHDRR